MVSWAECGRGQAAWVPHSARGLMHFDFPSHFTQSSSPSPREARRAHENSVNYPHLQPLP